MLTALMLTVREGDRTMVYLKDKQLSGLPTSSVGALVCRCAFPKRPFWLAATWCLFFQLSKCPLTWRSRRLNGASPQGRNSDLMVERCGTDVIVFPVPLTMGGLAGVSLLRYWECRAFFHVWQSRSSRARDPCTAH